MFDPADVRSRVDGIRARKALFGVVLPAASYAVAGAIATVEFTAGVGVGIALFFGGMVILIVADGMDGQETETMNAYTADASGHEMEKYGGRSFQYGGPLLTYAGGLIWVGFAALAVSIAPI